MSSTVASKALPAHLQVRDKLLSAQLAGLGRGRRPDDLTRGVGWLLLQAGPGAGHGGATSPSSSYRLVKGRQS